MDRLKIKAKVYEDWLENPITKCLLELIKERSIACRTIIAEKMLNEPDFDKINKTELAQFRGQHFAHEEVLDVKSFVSEKLVIIDEVKHDEESQT